MRSLILLIAIYVTSVAHAQTIKIFETSGHGIWRANDIAANFAVNRKLGRAWVEVTVGDRADYESDPAVHRVQVEGLSFDKTTSAVVLEKDGQLVECATVGERGRWIFRRSIIENTDRCQLSSRFIKLPVDDGFEIKMVRHLQAFLTID